MGESRAGFGPGERRAWPPVEYEVLVAVGRTRNKEKGKRKKVKGKRQ
jgi:hypothetical protein